MFGNEAAFANGNLFFGVYGDHLFVRLPEEEGKELLKHEGAGPFEPMPGRAMKGYYNVPKQWVDRPELMTEWVGRSLDWTLKLPSKKTRG